MAFKVIQVESSRDVDLQDKGWFTSFKVALDEDGTVREGVEIFQRKDSIPPKAGDALEGSIEQGKYGPKFKKASRLNGGGGFRGRDPKETAAIQRQHSQSVAVEYLKAQAAAGALEAFPSTDKLRALIDWFQRDIEWGVRLASAPAYGSEQRVKAAPKKPAPVSDVPQAGEGEFVHASQDMSGTPWSTE